MNNFKNVKENFSHAASNYNNCSDIQAKASRSLVSSISRYIDLLANNFIVDLGCGTGYVSDKIFELTGRKVDLSIDFSINSINLVTNSQIKAVADIRNLPFSCISSAKSIVVSSFALQWLTIAEIKESIIQILDSVAIDSVIAISIPVKNSFYQFLDANIVSNSNFRMVSLPDEFLLQNAISSLNADLIHLKFIDYNKRYNNAQDFLKSIKRIGAGYNFLNQNVVNVKKLKKLNDILFEKYNNNITWKTIEVIIKKT